MRRATDPAAVSSQEQRQMGRELYHTSPTTVPGAITSYWLAFWPLEGTEKLLCFRTINDNSSSVHLAG